MKKKIISKYLLLGLGIIIIGGILFKSFEWYDDMKTDKVLQKNYLSYREQGDKYIEDGNIESALTAYRNALDNSNGDDVRESAIYEKILNYYISDKDVEMVNRTIEESKENIKNPTEELKSIIDNEESKQWFPIKVVNLSSKLSERREVFYKYDEQGRVIESAVPLFRKSEMDGMTGPLLYHFEYLDDGIIVQKEFNETRGKYESWYYKFKLNENNIVTWYEHWDYNTDKMLESKTLYPEKVLEKDGVKYVCDDNWRLEEIINTNIPQTTPVPNYIYRYENEYDKFGNLINIVKYKYVDKEPIWQEADQYTYVYCHAEDLIGDISSFPISSDSNLEVLEDNSDSNTITMSNAVDIVKNSNKLADVKTNLRGEHEVYFSAEKADVQDMSGYTVNAIIDNPARGEDGKEIIGRFFVSNLGELYFYDVFQGLIFVPVD
jgi:hypothetical protein